MAFDLMSGYGAGAGADMLQQILREKAQEAFQQGTLADQQQKNAIAQQEADQRAAYQNELVKTLQDERTAQANLRSAQTAVDLGHALGPGADVTGQTDTQATLRAGGLGPLIQSQGASLPSTDIYGNVTPDATAAGGATLKAIGLHPAQDTFSGLASDQAAAKSQAALRMLRANLAPDDPLGKWIDLASTGIVKGEPPAAALVPTPTKTEAVMRQNPATGTVERLVNGQWAPWTADVPPDAHWMTEPPAKQGNYTFQPVTLPDGSPGLMRGNAMTGDMQPVVLPPGVGAGRPSAQSLMKSEDRKRAAAGLDQLDQAITNASSLIGPGAGRVSTIEQMIGDPDPRTQALGTKMLMAKMTIDAGIGGARAAASPQLLQRWDNLFSQKLTPEALHSTVQAMREMLNAGQTAPNSATGGATDPLGIRIPK